MSKQSIEQLSDSPIRPASSEDPRGTVWYRFIQEIEDLLAAERVSWAEDTLRDIQQTVDRTKRVSEGQRRAVDNIQAAADRQANSRRYEGYSRGRGRWR